MSPSPTFQFVDKGNGNLVFEPVRNQDDEFGNFTEGFNSSMKWAVVGSVGN